MGKFVLSNDMLTGIKDIDEQHRMLLTWGNAMFSDNTDAAVIVAEEALLELSHYASYHFRLEERAMAESGYEKLQKHRKQHDRLTRGVAKLVHRLKEEGTSRVLLIELQDQFIDWFVHHIKEWDQPFALFLKSNNKSLSLFTTEEDLEVDWTKLDWARS